MACACSKKPVPTKFVHTAPNGKKTVYSSLYEANYKKAREGGTVTQAK